MASDFTFPAYSLMASPETTTENGNGISIEPEPTVSLPLGDGHMTLTMIMTSEVRPGLVNLKNYTLH